MNMRLYDQFLQFRKLQASTAMASISIAVFQNDSVLMDKAAQLDALSIAAAKASHAGADLLLCPELFMTGYYLREKVNDLAESTDGPFIRRARKLASRHNIMLVFGYPEKARQEIYNSAVVIDGRGEVIANFRKLHLPGEYENSHFMPGNSYINFEIKGFKTSVLICYDSEYPETVRKLALENTELLLVPTALSSPYPIVAKKVIPTRAFENGIFIAYADFCGRDDTLAYAGQSCIVGPHGDDLARADDEEIILYATLDTNDIDKARSALPYLQQRRPDLYQVQK